MREVENTVSRRCLLRQGSAFGLVGLGIVAAGASLNNLPLAPAQSVRSKAFAGTVLPPVYVFASDPRASQPGFEVLPG